MPMSVLMPNQSDGSRNSPYRLTVCPGMLLLKILCYKAYRAYKKYGVCAE